MDFILLVEELGYEESEDNADGSIQGKIDFIVAETGEGDTREKHTAVQYFLTNDQETKLGIQSLQKAIDSMYVEEYLNLIFSLKGSIREITAR